MLVPSGGATKADLRDPQGTRNFFCFHFAKGRCSKGPECTFFHRIPNQKDGDRFDSSHDVFGKPPIHTRSRSHAHAHAHAHVHAYAGRHTHTHTHTQAGT